MLTGAQDRELRTEVARRWIAHREMRVEEQACGRAGVCACGGGGSLVPCACPSHARVCQCPIRSHPVGTCTTRCRLLHHSLTQSQLAPQSSLAAPRSVGTCITVLACTTVLIATATTGSGAVTAVCSLQPALYRTVCSLSPVPLLACITISLYRTVCSLPWACEVCR